MGVMGVMGGRKVYGGFMGGLWGVYGGFNGGLWGAYGGLWGVRGVYGGLERRFMGEG